MFEPGLIGLVLSSAEVSSLIGARLYAVILPENALFPSASYQIVAGTSEWVLGTAVHRMKKVQFDFWADEYKDAKWLEQAVTNVLDGFAGTLPDPDATRVISCFRSETIDHFDDTGRYFRVMNEYDITFSA